MTAKKMKDLNLIQFMNESPTASHAVNELKKIAKQKGYREIREDERWSLEPGEGFYLIREDTGFIAGMIGKKAIEKQRWNIAAAHTDSPGFRLKPNAVHVKQGTVLLGAEVYGGPLLSSWTDRDLSLAGRILLRETSGKIITRLWRCQKPVLRIPSAAIHLNRQVNDEGLKLNKQTQLVPLFKMDDPNQVFDGPAFIRWLGREIGEDPRSIVDFQLELYDTQPALLGGPDEEFLLSGRIDNLTMCYATAQALPDTGTVPEYNALVVCFDNEETGSKTLKGGDSFFLGSILERLGLSCGMDRESFLRSLSESILFSADGVHAIHPNYAELYEPAHPVYMNRGPALKVNAQNRYATSLYTSALFREIARDAGVPVQTYVHRSDLPCGSTIGPLVSARLGLKTLDAGIGMLSMHSVREMAGIDDIHGITAILSKFLIYSG
ncbi:MAG: M18 family aminopeptidase [Candidatus Marinimicrobia bacterium]|nr:M18 family aminopeptidase [Candidatus Neomarinimicrobiota bacterium]